MINFLTSSNPPRCFPLSVSRNLLVGQKCFLQHLTTPLPKEKSHKDRSTKRILTNLFFPHAAFFSHLKNLASKSNSEKIRSTKTSLVGPLKHPLALLLYLPKLTKSSQKTPSENLGAKGHLFWAGHIFPLLTVTAPKNHWKARSTPPIPPPPRNKALLSDNFLGGWHWGGDTPGFPS